MDAIDPEDVADIKAERRQRTKKIERGGRTDGSAVAPTGVPKGDHVADPLAAQAAQGDLEAQADQLASE